MLYLKMMKKMKLLIIQMTRKKIFKGKVSEIEIIAHFSNVTYIFWLKC